MKNTPDRTREPRLTIPDKIEVLMPRILTAEGEIPLYALTCGETPVIRVSLVFRAGTRYQQKSFCALTTANLLSEGTHHHTAAELAERVDFYGMQYDVNLDRDNVVITLCFLKKFAEESLAWLGEVVTEPAFFPDELSAYAAKRKQLLSVERQKPSYLARERFTAALYGADHPYGSAAQPDEYDRLTSEDLSAFHRRFYGAENCFAVCSGALDEPSIESVLTLLRRIPRGISRAESVIPSGSQTLHSHTEREGVQSAIRIGKPLFDRRHPDFNGMQIVGMILGGYFGSRLVKNLREEKGYTYGVFAAMVNLEQSGYLAIATEVATSATDDAVNEILREIERLRTEPVGVEELEAVRSMMTGEIMRILDGPFGIADVTIEGVQNAMDNHYVTDFFNEIKHITPQRIQQLAQRYLDPKTLTTVVVGAKS